MAPRSAHECVAQMEQSMTSPIQSIDLGTGQLMALEGGPGERVRLICGTAWLTQEGELGDTLLQAGTELPLRAGRTLIQALGPARLQIQGTARPPAAWLRLARHWRQWALRLQLGPVQPEPMA
jgi:Protein of unknown function (DUF2917)